jgi:hypothetical protein
VGAGAFFARSRRLHDRTPDRFLASRVIDGADPLHVVLQYTACGRHCSGSLAGRTRHRCGSALLFQSSPVIMPPSHAALAAVISEMGSETPFRSVPSGRVL